MNFSPSIKVDLRRCFHENLKNNRGFFGKIPMWKIRKEKLKVYVCYQQQLLASVLVNGWIKPSIELLPLHCHRITVWSHVFLIYNIFFTLSENEKQENLNKIYNNFFSVLNLLFLVNFKFLLIYWTWFEFVIKLKRKKDYLNLNKSSLGGTFSVSFACLSYYYCLRWWSWCLWKFFAWNSSWF